MAGAIQTAARPDRVIAFPRGLAVASDERLTQEMRSGNEVAFEVAYRRHSRGMLSLCRHLLGSPEEAEEALQHSLAAAWTDLQRTDRPAPESLKPWLYAIARHRCLSVLRSRTPDTLPLEEVPSTSGLAEEVGRRADLQALLADVRDLPEEQKTALLLSEIAGLSHADIADVLGRRESGIKALVFQARTTLGDWREAREAPCSDIREQLAELRGGALRRRSLRRHLQGCESCRVFRDELRVQRRNLRIVLPVMPAFGLKRGLFAALGLGGTGGGAIAGSVPALAPVAAASVALVSVGSLGSPAPAQPEAQTRSASPPAAERPVPPPTAWRSTTLVRVPAAVRRGSGGASRSGPRRHTRAVSRVPGRARPQRTVQAQAPPGAAHRIRRPWNSRKVAPRAQVKHARVGGQGSKRVRKRIRKIRRKAVANRPLGRRAPVRPGTLAKSKRAEARARHG